MIFDAVCCVEYLNEHQKVSIAEQKAFSEKINALTLGKLKQGGLGWQNILQIITSREDIDLENFKLDDLRRLFKNPQYIYDKTIEMWAKHYADYEKI